MIPYIQTFKINKMPPIFYFHFPFSTQNHSYTNSIQQQSMGLTESNSKQLDAQQKYKLIRRYTSDCYGDLTVIQEKQTQKVYALKELITEDDFIIKMIETRKKLKHKNLVKMQDYWFSGDQSICSNIRKVQMVFEYLGNTLDDEMKARVDRNEIFTDIQIMHIFADTIECLQYLEEINFLHLVGSMKMLLYDNTSKCIKIMQNQQMMVNSQRSKKKQINIINLLGSKKMLPLHPLNQPRDVCDVCLPVEKVTHQNLFVLGIICIGLCWMREPLQLGIFGKGGYIFSKIDKRINQIKTKYPRVHRILSLYMIQNRKHEKIATYNAILAQIYSLKKLDSKQNDKGQRSIQIQPVQKVGDKKQKKLSYLREMRLSNNDIPNQF